MRHFLVTMGVLALAAITPAVSRGDDQKIAETIIQRLQTARNDGKLAGFNVKLEVDEGTVWIKGHVSEQAQQDLVLDVARRVVGVRQVVNDIEVACEEPAVAAPTPAPAEPILDEPAYEPVSQSTIGSGINESPLDLPQSDEIPADEPVIGDPVGLIPAEAPSTEIQQIQRTEPAVSDQWIGRTLVSKLGTLDKQGALQGCGIDLHVEQRVIYLEGNTASDRQRDVVLDVARRIYGVRQVVNGIKVENPIRRTQAVAAGGPVSGMPVAMGQRPVMPVNNTQAYPTSGPVPMHNASFSGNAGVNYDHPNLPAYAWPSYAAHPNYAALQYPRQHSPSAWPYIGPFYPYPQVPLGWRKVSLEWDDGWWFLDFHSKNNH